MSSPDLMQYFVTMGMSPEVAAQLASKISISAPQEPPIANGIKIDPNDAVQNLLTSRYGMDPQQAAAYAGAVLAGTATGSREVQGEALGAVGSREQSRMQDITKQGRASKKTGWQEVRGAYGSTRDHIDNISTFVAAAKVRPEQRTPAQQAIVDQVDAETRGRMQQEASAHLTPAQREAEFTSGQQAYRDNHKGAVSLLAGHAKVLPNSIEPGKVTVLPTQSDLDLAYFDEIRKNEAFLDKQAQDDYREQLNVRAKLGPPGPGPQ